MTNIFCSENNAITKVDINSTLSDLYLYHCQLDKETEGRVALQLLNADPKLPGVLLMEDEQLIGMISRRRMLEQVSRPFGLELFLTRSLLRLYQYTKIDHLVLSEDTLIKDAARQALRRSTFFLDEPLVVEKKSNQYALLDVHQLLTAYANIFQMMTILLEKKNQQLQHLAVIDQLTGIGNRRFFDQYFVRDWQLAIREKQWITLVMIDVDYFKKYNDNYGHQAGDKCLSQVANLLQSHCKRSTDIVARYGGEEFVLSLLNTKLEQAI
ncbi:MAG: GGDEF domain-containing protein, partial [Microcystaceae cyanobacterium]